MKRLIDLKRVALRALCGAVILCTSVVAGAPESLDTFPTTTAQISTASGTQHFKIWVADTPARSEQGLMFIHSLPPDQGMLFPGNNSGQMTMWMKNTLIPLDMLFIDRSGEIIFIQHDAKPKSEAIIRLPAPVVTPVSAVLELAGGECVKKHISQGDHVSLVEH
jgi:uncharacterized membrane protein (UPF0127 family)